MARIDDLQLAIVAGGRGRRMGGVIKPLMRHADDASAETLIGRIVATLEPVAGPARVVAPADLAPVLRRAVGRPVIVDPGQGPPAAVATVAADIDTTWFAVVAADLVQVDAAVLEALAERRHDDIDAVIPVVDGFDQPLFAVFRTSAMRIPPPPSMMAWLRQIRTSRYPMDDRAEQLEDVDTPAEAGRHNLTWPAGYD